MLLGVELASDSSLNTQDDVAQLMKLVGWMNRTGSSVITASLLLLLILPQLLVADTKLNHSFQAPGIFSLDPSVYIHQGVLIEYRLQKMYLAGCFGLVRSPGIISTVLLLWKYLEGERKRTFSLVQSPMPV